VTPQTFKTGCPNPRRPGSYRSVTITVPPQARAIASFAFAVSFLVGSWSVARPRFVAVAASPAGWSQHLGEAARVILLLDLAIVVLFLG
jgi:hypothetical protein